MEPEFLLSIDYYQGAFGPTLRLVCNTADVVRGLAAVFHGLGSGGINQQDLLDLLRVNAPGIASIALIATGTRVRRSSQIRKSVTGDTRLAFEWVQSNDDWVVTAELLDGLLESGSGHQYLTPDGEGLILVEVSFGEG